MDKKIADGLVSIRGKDQVLGAIINRIGPCSLKPSRDYFGSLARTIVSQQLSVNAADAILSRFQHALGGKIVPSLVLALSDLQFRRAGISEQKRSYLRDLASKFEDNAIDIHGLHAQDDEALIKYLTGFRGIGRWSAEMFLIFCLNRLDVLPLDDVGIRRAVRINYGLTKIPSDHTLRRLSKQWEPFRSIAVWYLWKSIDG